MGNTQTGARVHRIQKVAVVVGGALLFMPAVAACGGSGPTTGVTASVVTVTAPATPPAATSVVTVTATPTPARETSTSATAGSPQSTVPVVKKGVVPNVVGMQHQLAQDTMQAAGFYNLSEEDATGRGRMLLDDRNWVVVSQEPTGGTSATSDRTIILRSKKKSE